MKNTTTCFPARVLLPIVLSLGLSASALAQNCVKPAAAEIDIPDGESATREQMLETQQLVNAYVDKMNGYLTCLDERSAELPEGEAGDRARAINDARYNAARDELMQVAESFNTQVRIYRIRQETPE
jgi:hypothetical protein